MVGGVIDEPAGNDLLGTAIAIDGDVMAVGAFSDDVELEAGQGEASTVGSVYVFRRVAGQWLLEQRLLAPDAEAGAEFGTSLALQGDRLVVGARGHDSAAVTGGSPLADQGKAYVFRRDLGVWSLDAELVPDPALGALAAFGWAVALWGDRIVVGAPGVQGGRVDVFRLDAGDWVIEQRLQRPDQLGFGGPNAFGRALSLSQDRLLVGAPLEDNPPFTHGDAGAAYVFLRNAQTWSVEARLTPSVAHPAAAFATAVALQGNEVLIGAPFEPEAGLSSAGAAYHFRHQAGAWQSPGRLTARQPQQNGLFGQALALDWPHAAVAAPWSTGALGFQQGAVDLLDLSASVAAWLQTLRAPALTAAAFNQFGSALSLSGPNLAVGEPRFTDVGLYQGAAHVFAPDPDALFADGFESAP